MKRHIHDLVNKALEDLGYGSVADFDILTPKEEFGDYSANVAMVVFKSLENKPEGGPAALATVIAEKAKEIDAGVLFDVVEAKQGFVNFTLSRIELLKNTEKILEKGNDFGKSNVGNGETIVVEYFQNNVAKPPHVGHLRSAVIGDSIKRMFTSLGYTAISDTHIGDWGVQFGILLYAYKTMGHRELIEKDPIAELNKLYVEMSKKIEEEPILRDLGKQEFVKLEQGDEENRKLWEWFVSESKLDFEKYRKLLGVLPFDLSYGEAFYEDKMAGILSELEAKGLVKVGETGEKYVDLEDEGLGRCILVKSDGGTTYHMRDFATYVYIRTTHPNLKHVYVVDVRQSHHFKQLFRVLEKAGYPSSKDAVHVEFGFMSLPEGAISTRKGTTVSLENLLNEAKVRSLELLKEKSPALENKGEVAEQLGLAAIKYFDLSHNRKSEIVFTFDKAVSFEGNTGPYLQYTHARIHGILRKTEVNEVSSAIAIQELHEKERALVRHLYKYGETVENAAREYFPHLICQYLFELAQKLNSFYDELSVVNEADETKKQFRIQLISAVAYVLKNGLHLLGIEAPEKM